MLLHDAPPGKNIVSSDISLFTAQIKRTHNTCAQNTDLHDPNQLRITGIIGFVHLSKFEITRYLNVSETGCVSIFRWREGYTRLFKVH
jgi:hypothetical protein